MENEEFREIMEALKELSVDQAVIKEKIDSHIERSEKKDEHHEKLKSLVAKHNIFMQVSLWVYGLVASVIGYKYYH